MYNYFLEEAFHFYPIEFESPSIILRETLTYHEQENLKEIKSQNDNFMQEKNINYKLYPLYINWKKIETKDKNNIFYNIFILFGYFGEAIFNILTEINHNEIYCNHRNFLYKLNAYKKNYTNSQIKENEFMKKLISIYDDVISLIKNRIIIFKEISIFLIIMRLYENYFLIVNDNNKLLEVLKYEFFIIYNLKDTEYKKIYDKCFKKIDHYYDDYDEEIWSVDTSRFPKNKKLYINNIKRIYKKISRNNQMKIKEE